MAEDDARRQAASCQWGEDPRRSQAWQAGRYPARVVFNRHLKAKVPVKSHEQAASMRNDAPSC